MDLPDSGMGTSYPQYGAASASNATPPPPICQLPTELLVQVLHSVLPPVDLASKPVEPRLLAYMRRLYNMRPVMKRWHEIIDGTPSFWTFVLSSLPSHVNDAIILRSNNGPLAVVYSIAIGNADEHPSSGDFLRAVAHTYPRWCAYRGPVVTGYLGTPAPLLRHVTLLGKFDDDEPLELLDGCSTSLRYVDVYQVSIRWKMGLFSHLNVLKLRRVGRNSLTTGHLLDFLQASPHLELLELTDVEATSSTLHYPSAITLHLLRSIMVCACDNNVVEAILCHIRAPSCIQFWVTVFQLDEPNLPEFLDANFQHFRGSLRAIHEHVGISEIVLDSSGFQWQTLATSADSHRFYLSIDCTAPSSCISWVDRILRGDSGLSIHFGHGADASDAVLETLAPMRCVTKALIGGNAGREETLRILRFLGKLRSMEPSLPSLPDLRELRLTSVGWDAQDLIDMIHSRFDALSWKTTERPLLSITMSRGALSWTGSARPILDYAMLTKIRNTDGVSSATFVGPPELDGMLGVTWDEETSKPVWR